VRRKQKKPLAFSRKRRLSLSPDRTFSHRVPKRWVKFVVGCFLLLPAAILTETFFSVFTRSALHHQFWATEEFWFFSLGIVVWMIAFVGLPRPIWLYVFGHELTHAIWVWLMGGSVFQLKVRKDGGYILADRVNTWIALAPYFFPIYSLLVVILYGVAGIFWDISHLRQAMFAFIGATWAFHLTFTCWAIWKGQQDLAYGGTFFSLVVIYMVNLAVLVGMFLMASPTVSLWDFLKEFFTNMDNFFQGTAQLLRRISLYWLPPLLR
jgi:hypothetical protein